MKRATVKESNSDFNSYIFRTSSIFKTHNTTRRFGKLIFET